jgi:ABC-type multidrug transport system fused ATPase/permease subunit
MRGDTTFMIAHRPKTPQNCDLRPRIENGRRVNAKRNRSTVRDGAAPDGASLQQYES